MNTNPKKSKKKKLKIPKPRKKSFIIPKPRKKSFIIPKPRKKSFKRSNLPSNNLDLATMANNIISNSREIPKCNKDEKEYLKNLAIEKKNPGSVSFTKKKIPIYTEQCSGKCIYRGKINYLPNKKSKAGKELYNNYKNICSFPLIEKRPDLYPNYPNYPKSSLIDCYYSESNNNGKKINLNTLDKCPWNKQIKSIGAKSLSLSDKMEGAVNCGKCAALRQYHDDKCVLNLDDGHKYARKSARIHQKMCYGHDVPKTLKSVDSNN